MMLWVISLLWTCVSQTTDASLFVMEKYAFSATIVDSIAITEVQFTIRNDNVNDTQLNIPFEMPELAFISKYVLAVDGTEYVGKVKSEDAAKKEFDDAVANGTSAGLVIDDKAAVRGRGMRIFSMSAFVGPGQSAVFTVTYEELLVLRRGEMSYLLSLNTYFKKSVANVSVSVDLRDSTRASSSGTTDNLVCALGRTDDAPASSKYLGEVITDKSTCKWLYKPTAAEQGGELHERLKLVQKKSVERNPKKGSLLLGVDTSPAKNANQPDPLGNACVMQLWSPDFSERLPKMVVFVLDRSGSMSGVKIVKMRSAFQEIVKLLDPQDYFAIIAYDRDVTHWPSDADNTSPYLIAASPQNVQRGAEFVKAIEPKGATNIYDATKIALDLLISRRAQSGGGFETLSTKYLPLELLLTDGQPNAGAYSTPSDIVKHITAANSDSIEPVLLFTLAFGHGADIGFLGDLAVANNGYSAFIYSESSADQQLIQFWEGVGYPVAKEVGFSFKCTGDCLDTIAGSTTLTSPVQDALVGTKGNKFGTRLVYDNETQNTFRGASRSKYPMLANGSEHMVICGFNTSVTNTTNIQDNIQLGCTIGYSQSQETAVIAAESVNKEYTLLNDFFPFCRRGQVSKLITDLLQLEQLYNATGESTKGAEARAEALKLALDYELVVGGLTALISVAQADYAIGTGGMEMMDSTPAMGGAAMSPGVTTRSGPQTDPIESSRSSSGSQKLVHALLLFLCIF